MPTIINDGTGSKVPLITVKGKGNFKGTDMSTTFDIAQRVIGDGSVQVVVPDQVYSTKRKEWKASVTVVDTDGKKLSSGTDYEKVVTYSYKESGKAVADSDIVPVGTSIVVTVTGKGKYTGTVTGEYGGTKKITYTIGSKGFLWWWRNLSN